MAGRFFHHKFLHGHIRAGIFSLEPLLKVFPGSGIQKDGVKAKIFDQAHSLADEIPVIVGGTVKISEPEA